MAKSVRYAAPGWGVGELWLEGEQLVHHELPVVGPEPGPPHPLGERLSAYFAGENMVFDDVELDLEGWTRFQRASVEALRAVPRGEVVTYGELAALAGHPGAQRAAGSFCAHNRFPIVVPCHRVVGSTGKLVGYGGGLDRKLTLLRLEGSAPAA